MKTAKLELNSLEAAELYRGLGAHERELRTDKDANPVEIAMSLASIDKLKEKVAVIFEKTRPIEKKKGAKA